MSKSKKRIRVKTTTKYQARLDREIRKFYWDMKNRELNVIPEQRKKEKITRRYQITNPAIEREINEWKTKFIDKMLSEE